MFASAMDLNATVDMNDTNRTYDCEHLLDSAMKYKKKSYEKSASFEERARAKRLFESYMIQYEDCKHGTVQRTYGSPLNLF